MIIFSSLQEALSAGYRRVDYGVDKDISGPTAYGYEYENAAGERTTPVFLSDEKNRIGTIGAIRVMYPPVAAPQ